MKTKTVDSCGKLILIVLATAGALILLCPTAGQALADSKTADLEKKIADIDLLRQQLGDRVQQAYGIRTELARQKSELIGEIGEISGRKKIKSFHQASEEPRIRYDLELLRLIGACMSALEDKIRLYRTHDDKLAYLQQSAADDLKMLAAVNDLKIDALATQISLVISHCLPEAHVIRLDPAALQPISAEKAWEAVASGRF